jgi:hypothetical protein
MTYYNSYDDWKLSNPDDDGHYTEETNVIEENAYFKYSDGRRWVYGMLTKNGWDIRIESYHRIPTIDIDEFEPTQSEFDDTLYRVRMNYTHFNYIQQDEFMERYNEARNLLDKLMEDETSN